VGGEETLKSDARIIAATNRDLKLEMQRGAFREDLYWRLNVIPIHVPPLRERKEDIPQLTANFINRFNERLGKHIRAFAPDAMDLIFSHHWPGNIRELENAVERAMALAKEDIISSEDLPAELRQGFSLNGSDPASNLERIERDHIRGALEQCGWNKYKAAKIMGISRSTLYSKIRKHGLCHPSLSFTHDALGAEE
jgi:DNA-binding NtrC family response regulator